MLVRTATIAASINDGEAEMWVKAQWSPLIRGEDGDGSCEDGDGRSPARVLRRLTTSDHAEGGAPLPPNLKTELPAEKLFTFSSGS